MRLIDADAMLKRNTFSIYDTTDLKEMLENEPTVNQWIPVSERLPECDDYYICSTKVGGCVYVTILQYISEQDELDDLNGEVGFYDLDSHYDYVYGCYSKDVIAWMPLPEVYKEEEQ